MIVYVEYQLFEDLANSQNLYHLINLVLKDGNSILCDLSELENKEYFDDCPTYIKEYLRLSYSNAMLKLDENMNVGLRVDIESDEESFNLNESIRYFQQPISIVLENNNYDEYLLQAIFRNFPKESKKLNQLIEDGRMIFENGGGKDNIKVFIEGRKRSYHNLPKEPFKYLRFFVLFDSDKKYPDDTKNQALKDYLISNAIFFHELEKREMENYMPDEIFEDINDEYCQKYLKLSNIQKDYFDVQNGFYRKKIESLHHKIQELYNDISVDDYSFFKRKKFDHPNFKSEFAKKFENGNVTKNTLKARISHQRNSNEFIDIINKIKEV